MNFTAAPHRVSRLRKETDEAVSITFEDPTGRLAYTAGQFLTLNVEVEGQMLRRAYSICSSQATNEGPTVCVKAVPQGKVSNALVFGLKEGAEVAVFPAIGNFTYESQTGKKRHIVLIGAGSGITPLFSILKTALVNEPEAHVSLIYGNRREDCIIFHRELTELEHTYAGRFRVAHTLTQASESWQGQRGRISTSVVKELLYHMQPLTEISESLFYLCGPQGLMEELETFLRADGHPKNAIHRESFFSDHTEAVTGVVEESKSAFDGPSMVDIILEGKTYSIQVPKGETILQTALDQDIEMPYSCQAGLCTACRGKCVTGTVRMEETEGLSDSEIAQGYVLTCVGHAETERVTIEMG
jgi:ring-1,2-phenylacetyl-CoA epoxidase subunit PaaE